MPLAKYQTYPSGKSFSSSAFLFALLALLAAALAPVGAWAAGGIGLTHIAVGFTHSCGLTTGGGVMCWGENSHGQLGNGLGGLSTPPSPDPVHVAGLTGGVVGLALGGGHSCALTAGGQVKCWGWNGSGQLGNGRVDAGSSTPVAVGGLASVTKISAGEYHTCALTAGGGVSCWGNNVAGQLGGGTIEMTSSIPIFVPGLGSGAIDLTTGSAHTCVLTPTAGVKCWGDNSTGQLGNGTTGSGGSTPVDVLGLIGITALSTGGTHNCALTAGGGVKCWGNNYSGQLGDGTKITRPEPVDVTSLTSGVVAVTAGDLASTCAVTASGGIKCWGLNDHGQLGDGSKITRTEPVDVTGLPAGLSSAGLPAEGGTGVSKPTLADLATSPTTVQVAPGSAHTCAFTSWAVERPYLCWGGNNLGQLGNGAIGADQAAPAPVKKTFHSPSLQWLVAGQQHTCALTPAGAVKCWGNNSMGQSGDGTIQPSTTPVQVAGMTTGVTGLAAGDWHTCALTPSGNVACWGQNVWGQLGGGTTAAQSNIPVNVVGLNSVITGLAAGEKHTCALTPAGGVKCWGDNLYGQLGNGSNNPTSTPVNVTGLASGVTAIAAGYNHTCALTAGGGVKCWGGNLFGSLGDGSGSMSNTPIDVVGLPSAGVTAIAANGHHTCALVLDSLRNTGVMCWGSNGHGETGNGSTAPVSAAAPVIGLSAGVTAIAAGLWHACALTAGGVSCWGYNLLGQLGDGTNSNRFTPVNVVGLEAGATTLTAGTQHTCAAVGTGTSPVLCWGDNSFGQFGDGTTGNSSNVPVPSKWLTADGLVEDNKGTVIIPPDLHNWIDIPPQTVATPTVVTYTQIPAVTPPNGLQQVGNAFTLLPDDDAKLPVRMWFHMDFSGGGLRAPFSSVSDSGGFDATTVNLYRDDNGTWVPVLPCEGCSVNPASHTLVALINAWGRYAVMAQSGNRIYLPLILR